MKYLVGVDWGVWETGCVAICRVDPDTGVLWHLDSKQLALGTTRIEFPEYGIDVAIPEGQESAFYVTVD